MKTLLEYKIHDILYIIYNNLYIIYNNLPYEFKELDYNFFQKQKQNQNQRKIEPNIDKTYKIMFTDNIR